MMLNRLLIRKIYCIFLILLHGLVSFSYAEEENNGLNIMSEADVSSPDGMAGKIDEKTDLERTTIGIGEMVTLTLDGKLLPQVDKNSIEWKIEDGKDLIQLSVREGDKTQAFLKANVKMEKAEGKVTIKVKTNLKDINPEKEFTIINPTSISATHSGLRGGDHPVDGEKYRWGASSLLILQFEPTDVSFSQVYILEKANDGDADIPKHEPSSLGVKVNLSNQLKWDTIGGSGLLDNVQPPNALPKDFVWKCSWYTYANNKVCWKISGDDYEQKFKFTEGEKDADNPNRRNVCLEISKFGRTVKRCTSGEAKHEDS